MPAIRRQLARRLLMFGQAMVGIYLAMFAAAALLAPRFSIIRDEPSMLGSAGAPHPLVYNAGMLATAACGCCAALGLFVGLRRIGSGALPAALTAISLVTASAGLAMAGSFPLPSDLHYGFGMTAAGLLVPLLGAIALARVATARRDAAILALLFALVLVLAVAVAVPLFVGLAMLGSVAFLSRATRSRL